MRREDISIAHEILEFIEKHGARSVAMTDRIIGCPHQEGIDYHGEWCPVCEFWRGRDRFTRAAAALKAQLARPPGDGARCFSGGTSEALSGL